MYEFYKCTFKLLSPIVYMDMPVFDSILGYAVYSSMRKITDRKTPQGSEIDEIELPLRKDAGYGFYYASYMQYDTTVEGVSFWTKRWDTRYDFLVGKGRISVSSGHFKSYDIPLVIHSCDMVWFYFDGDPDEVSFYIGNYLVGIGKKVKTGYGWIEDFSIEQVKMEQNMCLSRPLPKLYVVDNFDSLNGIDFKITDNYKFPYWRSG